MPLAAHCSQLLAGAVDTGVKLLDLLLKHLSTSYSAVPAKVAVIPGWYRVNKR
jgi:hypothetical protein